MVGAAASLYADQTRGQLREELGNLIAPELLLQHSLAVLVYAMHLEQVLCQIDTDCRNLHDGRPSRFKWLLDTSTLAR